MKKNHIALLLLSTLIIIFSIKSIGDENSHKAGSIVKVQGTVLIKQQKESRPIQINTPGTELSFGSMVRTKNESTAYVELNDDSKVILKEKSQLRINESDQIDVEKGMILFDISKIQRKHPFRVKVKFGIIGIRGTQLLVDARGDDYKIYLKEGSMYVESEQQGFELYEKQFLKEAKDYNNKVQSELKQFKSDMEQGMAQYEKNSKIEHAQFVKRFDIPELSGVSIKGNVARRVPIPEEIQKEFKLFENF